VTLFEVSWIDGLDLNDGSQIKVAHETSSDLPEFDLGPEENVTGLSDHDSPETSNNHSVVGQSGQLADRLGVLSQEAFSNSDDGCLQVCMGSTLSVADSPGIMESTPTSATHQLHYINNSGGTKSVLLCKTTWDMLQWCLINNIELRAAHIPGKDNCLADQLSRHIVSHLEWELDSQVVQQLFHLWHTPTIDLFASFQNAKLNRFCALRFHPQAENTDALSMSWRSLYAYAFPPFPILARVLQKIQQDQATMILIAPNWPRREWFPFLLELLIEYPRQLPNIPNLITQNQGSQIHPNLSTLHLVAWKVSGNVSLQTAFRNRQLKLTLSPRQIAQERRTTLAGQISLLGVEGTISIPILSMSPLS
jgi:hypothetical protein